MSRADSAPAKEAPAPIDPMPSRPTQACGGSSSSPADTSMNEAMPPEMHGCVSRKHSENELEVPKDFTWMEVAERLEAAGLAPRVDDVWAALHPEEPQPTAAPPPAAAAAAPAAAPPWDPTGMYHPPFSAASSRQRASSWMSRMEQAAPRP